MDCPDCGYANPDDALVCGLCQKVLRKEKGPATSPAPHQPTAAPPDFTACLEDIETLSMGMLRLDATPASLLALDLFVNQLWGLEPRAKRDATYAQFEWMFGCYVGEVMRKTLGGRWLPDAAHPDCSLIAPAKGPQTCPFVYVSKRHDHGERQSFCAQVDGWRWLVAAANDRSLDVMRLHPGDFPPSYPGEAVHWVAQALALQGMGKRQAAGWALERAIALDPRLPEARLALGRFLHDAGRLEEALAALDKANDLGADTADLWEARALVLGALKRGDEALACLDRVVTCDAKRLSAWLARGDARLGRDRLQDALSDFDRAVELDAAAVRAWQGRVTCLRALGRQEEELAAVERLLEIQRGTGVLERLRRRVDLLVELGRLDDASAACDKLIRSFSKDPDGWLRKADIEERAGRVLGAVRACQGCLKLDPQNAEAVRRMRALDLRADRWRGEGIELAGRGQVMPAIECFTRAIEIDPLCKEARRQRAIGLAMLKRFDDAVAAFEEGIRLHPDDPVFHADKATTLARAGRTREALDAVTKACELSSGGAQAWALRAECERRLGRAQEAADSLRRCIDAATPQESRLRDESRRLLAQWERGAAPAGDGEDGEKAALRRSAERWCKRGALLAKEGKTVDALKVLETAVGIDATNAECWWRKASMERALGRPEERESLRRFIGLPCPSDLQGQLDDCRRRLAELDAS